MGKGDKKSKRGKIAMGSYGVKRKKRKAKKVFVAGNKVKPKTKAVEEDSAKMEVAEKPKKVAAPKKAAEKPAEKKPVAKKPAVKKSK